MSLRKQLPSFVMVGATAALVHWSSFTGLVHLGLHPVWAANPLAFLIAFCVSYLGQRHLTFQAGDLAHARVLPRFFLVAVLNFLLNDMLLWLARRYLPLPAELDLAIILVLIAGITFLSSRHWAFSRHR